MFLDARPVGAVLTHVFLPEPRTDPAFLIRWLHLRPPDGYKTVVRPRAGDDGRLHLTEGEVVVFGFVENRPGDTDSDDADDDSSSVGLESGSEDGPGPDPDGPPRGPPPPVPWFGSQGDPNGGSRSSGRNRSRSPPPTAPAAQPSTRPGLHSSNSPTFRVEQFPTRIEGLGLAPIVFSAQIVPAAASTLRECVATVADACFWTILALGASLAFALFLLRALGLTFRGGAGLAPRACKLLQEPQGQDTAAQSHLDTLRDFVRAIGGPWMPRLPHDIGHLLHQDADVQVAIGQADDVATGHVPCAILTYDYQTFRTLVAVNLPATPDELELALQAGRGEVMRMHFPALLPTLPQPFADTAVFIAAPHWCPFGHGVCFDSTQIDRRIYETFAPEYVSLEELPAYR